jgi:hypothetical protein
MNGWLYIRLNSEPVGTRTIFVFRSYGELVQSREFQLGSHDISIFCTLGENIQAFDSEIRFVAICEDNSWAEAVKKLMTGKPFK